MKATIGLLVILIATTGFAQNSYIMKDGKMTVSGTSSLHDWESDVTEITWNGALTLDGTAIRDIENVTVKIPVKSIKSTKGKMMDSKTYDAFDAEKNPYITFKMNQCQVTGTTIVAKGTLTMAGKTKPIQLEVKNKVVGNDIQLTGSYKINIKDYSMEPPTAMMGTIKVGEQVTVNFSITVTQK